MSASKLIVVDIQGVPTGVYSYEYPFVIKISVPFGDSRHPSQKSTLLLPDTPMPNK